MKKTKNWIFDFDGTLIDSAPSVKICFEKVTNDIAPKRIQYAKNLQIGPTLTDASKTILGEEFLHKTEEFISQFKYFPRTVSVENIYKIYLDGPQEKSFLSSFMPILPSSALADVNMHLGSGVF